MGKRVLAWLACGAAAAMPAHARGRAAWDTAGTVGEDALIAAALALPAVRRDWAGDLQAGESVAAAFAASEVLKRAFPERRPDGSDRRSFPSGHTAVSFAAAATLQNRYGWATGAPAQVFAALVGASRIAARKHHWYDVAVGAGIGEASGFLLTSRRDARVRVVPWGDGGGGGATLAWRF